MSSWAVGDDTVVARLRAATVPRTESRDQVPARFALELRPGQDPVTVSTMVELACAELGARVTPLSILDPEILILDLMDRALAAQRSAACFAAPGPRAFHRFQDIPSVASGRVLVLSTLVLVVCDAIGGLPCAASSPDQ